MTLDHTKQLTNRPLSIDSIHSSQQTYQDSLKRFEQLYALVERRQKTNFDNSESTSNGLFV